MKTFIDTNVLNYARDIVHPDKRAAARNWLTFLGVNSFAVVNLQLINEFCQAALRRGDADPGAIPAEVLDFRQWGETPLDVDIYDAAWLIRARTRYQWFDCLLLASALREECSIFLSEDMDHQRRIDGLTIVNPFTMEPRDIYPTIAAG